MTPSRSFSWAKVFLFGDSITQRNFSPQGCWGSLLADYLFRRCDIINRGFSGYNSRWARLILPGLLTPEIAKDVVAMTICLGANDASHQVIGEIQHVPVEEYSRLIKEMVEYCVSVGLRPDQIIIISPPAPYGEDWDEHCRKLGIGGVGFRDVEGVANYASACCKIADEMGTNFVDLYSKMMENKNYREYLCDGLHLSESGSQLLFIQLRPIIERLTSHIPGIAYPDWKELGGQDLESARKTFETIGYPSGEKRC